MSIFTSPREKRLWGWTLVVVVAIYSTLGLARTLVGALGDGALGSVLFIVGCLLVLATIVTQGLRRRPSSAELGIALGVAATYLLVLVRMSVPAERTHLIEYGVVALFMYEALTERARHGRRVPLPALTTIVATALVGLVDEGIQAMLPSRVFDLRDVGFNGLAAVMAVVTSISLAWARRRVAKAARG